MNGPLPSCESFEETISLLAAGCLVPEEEIEARRHLANCAPCRERFEQFVVVCDALQAAGPEERSSGAGVAISRAMAEIGSGPTRRGDHSPAALRAKSRRRLVIAAAVAASLMAIVGWRSFLSVTPHPPNVVDRDPSKMRPVPKQELKTAVVGSAVASNPPTWLALQRAAARSDEALDDLLARGNESVHFTPLDTHSLFQETDL